MTPSAHDAVGEPITSIGQVETTRESGSHRVIGYLRANGAFLFGCTVITFWVIAALTAPLWSMFDPIVDQDLGKRLAAPDSIHWFGTDGLGRDVFARVMYGARLTLPVALIAVTIALTIGCLLGAIAGFVGGFVDELIMRISDLFLAFPAMVLALAIAAALGPSSTNVVIAIVVVTWPEYTRLMRGQILSIRGNLHVLAAKSVGCSTPRIFRLHVLPFGLPPILVKATVDLGMAILLAAGLSFIGVGAAPPAPEWGAMVSEAATRIDQWWLGLFPGLAILSIILAVNFIGDALRDRFDPKMRGQRKRRSSARQMVGRSVLPASIRKQET
ncbi:ABC transporter permease [Rhodococcus sp. NPDC060176]|uniref:ABC transporter permease n=1 Tax=Rhodococcus sp. NPDC060176 TaxID=3347062 RepID=UPI00366724AD